MAEYVDEIDEQENGVPHIIFIAHSALFQDDSRVVHDEPTDNEESKIEMDLIQQGGSDEKIDQREHQ